MITTIRITSVLALLGTLSVACARCGGEDAQRTLAAGDASAAPQSRPSATTDSAPITCETSAVSDWPGWHRVAVSTAFCDCKFDIPADLTKEVGSLDWRPCADGGSECQDLRFTPRPDGVRQYFAVARVSPGKRFLHFTRTLDQAAFEDDVFDLATGKPLAGWRVDALSKCNSSVALGPNVVGLYMSLPHYQSGVVFGTPEELGRNPRFVPQPPDLEGRELRVGQFETSDTTLAFDLQPARAIARARIDSKDYRTALGSGLSWPMVAGDDVYAWSEHGTDGWSQEYLVGPNTGKAALYRGKPNTVVSGFRSDGTTMFWLELSGDANPLALQPKVEVWGAPYTNDPSVLASTAQRIAVIPGPMSPRRHTIAFDGLFAFEWGETAFVVRRSDGAIKQIAAGHGRYFWGTMLVTPTELWSMMGELPSLTGVAISRYSLGVW